MQTLQKPPKPECSKKNFRRDILTAESQSATWQASVRDLSLIHIFLLEGGGFYGTQWDDEAISPLALRLPGEGTEADRGQDGVVSEREEPDEGVQGRTSGDRKAGEREPGIGESERRERNDRESAEIEWNDRESTEKEWSDGETAEREWGDGKEKERGESGREMQEKEETDGVGEETLPTEDRETERDLAQGEDGGFADMEGEMESLEEHTENPNDISERSADCLLYTSNRITDFM